MMAWSRLAMVRSGPGISGILGRPAFSPAALSFFQRSSALSSLARSFIAARSSAENPSNALPVVLLADLRVPFLAVLLSAIAKHLLMPNEYPLLALPAQPAHVGEVPARGLRLGGGGACDLGWRRGELRPPSLDERIQVSYRRAAS